MAKACSTGWWLHTSLLSQPHAHPRRLERGCQPRRQAPYCTLIHTSSFHSGKAALWGSPMAAVTISTYRCGNREVGSQHRVSQPVGECRLSPCHVYVPARWGRLTGQGDGGSEQSSSCSGKEPENRIYNLKIIPHSK